MKIYLKKKSATRGTIVIVVDSKANRKKVIQSFHPEYSKDRKNNLLIDKIPTREVNGIEYIDL